MFHRTSSILIDGVRRSLWFLLFGLVFLGLHATASLADKSAARSLHNIGLLDQVLARVKPGQKAVNIDDQLFKVETLVGYRALLTGDLRPSSSFSMVARWPGGVVPYIYDETMNSSALRAAFEAACREWEQHANVRFVPRTSEPNYLKIRSSDTNSSYIGMIGGVQELNIYNWNYKFIICHELAHALGVIHEQCRSDRDNYVSIRWDNIQAGTENNFAILSNSLDQGNYDFDSVMHYGLNSFSKNGQNTIQLNVNYNSLIGQRDHLSNSDKAGMAAIYGPPGPIQRPANDDFANARLITGFSGALTSTNVNASKQSGEFAHAGNAGGTSVWYRWVAPASGPCVLSTTGSTTPVGSIMDTLLAVYAANGSSGSTDNPFSGLQEVARNDDEIVNSLYTSRVQFHAHAGVEYSIAVDGYSGATGNITLSWQGQAPVNRPANDNFQFAQLIGNASGSVNGSNINGTKEPDEPDYIADGGGASVWYDWTAPQTDSYTFRLTSTFSAHATIFEAASTTSASTGFPPLNQLAELDLPSSSASIDATAGRRYYILIDGSNGATGTFTLAWKPTQAPSGYSVGGFIKTSIGTPVANVPVQLTGASSAVSITDINGQYSFSGVATGTYRVQPNSAAYVFGPPGWNIEVKEEDLFGVDFLAVSGTTIGGRVTDRNGYGLSGVRVTCKGKNFSSNTTTTAEGFYAFPGMTSGTYTIKVSKSRVKFTPSLFKVKLSTNSYTNNNFVAK